MSPPAAQQVLSALRLMRGQDGSSRGSDKIAALHDNANYLRRKLLDLGCNVLGEWNSPVMVRGAPGCPLHAFAISSRQCSLCSTPALMVDIAQLMLPPSSWQPATGSAQ
jgi:hypothetical protein